MRVEASSSDFAGYCFVAEDRIAGFFGTQLWVWSFREGSARKYFLPPNDIRGVGATAGNAHRNLFACAERGCFPKVYVYNMARETPQPLHAIENATSLDLANLTFSRDGSRLYTLSRASTVTLKAFSMESGELLTGCDVQFDVAFQDVVVSPHDKNHIAVVNTVDHDLRFIRLEKTYDQNIAHVTNNVVPPEETGISCYTWAPASALLIFVTQGMLYIAQVRGCIVYAAKFEATKLLYFTALHLVTASAPSSGSQTKLRYWQYEDLNDLEGKEPTSEVVTDIERSPDAPLRLRKIGTVNDGPLINLAVAPDFFDAVCLTEKGDVVRLMLPSADEVQQELTKRESEMNDEGELLPVDDIGVVKVHRISWHHRAHICGVAFLGDRWTAASVDIAGCLRIWNAEATKSIQYLHGLTCVTRVAGSAALVVGSETGCVRLVSTAPLQTACAVRVCEVPILAVCTAKRANGVVVVTALTLDERILVMSAEDKVSRLVVHHMLDVSVTAHHLAANGLEIVAVGTFLDSTDPTLEQNALYVINCSDLAASKVCSLKVSTDAALTSVCRSDAGIIVGDTTGRVSLYVLAEEAWCVPVDYQDIEPQWTKRFDQASAITCLVPCKGGLLAGSADGAIAVFRNGAYVTHRIFSAFNSGVVSLDCVEQCVVGCDGEGVIVLNEDSTDTRANSAFQGDGSYFVDEENEHSLPLWNPRKEEDADAVVEEDAQVQQQQRALTVELDGVRKKLRALVDANKHCPQLEVLEAHEFCIDWEERDRIAQLTRERCDTLEAQIKKENVERTLIRDRLIKEFWTPMRTPGTEICSLSSKLKVANYPARVRDDDEQLFNQLNQFREVERLEAQWSESSGNPVSTTKAPKPTEFACGQEPYIMNWGVPQDSAPQKALYSPFDLVTDTRRRMQMVFFRELAGTIRHNFNERFAAMQVQKKNEMGSITDKVTRIQQILQELGLDKNEVRAPELQECEIAELVLKVEDGEVQAEKWVSPEEQAALDATRAKEEERLRKLRENDAGGRALQQMMGGTLKTKKDLSPLEMTLEREEWMDIPYDDMTDVQKAAFDDFEVKEKALREEQAKYRSQLEAELKTLKQNILDCMGSFEDKLKALHDDRYRTDFQFFCQELYAMRLMLAILQNIEDEARAAQLERQEQQCAQNVAKATRVAEDFSEEIRATTQKYEECQRKEREHVLGFKGLFASSGLEPESIQALSKLFRAKPRPRGGGESSARQSSQMSPKMTKKDMAEATGTIPFVPFVKEVAVVQEEDTLPETAEVPEGVDDSHMQKMWQCRQDRLALERECREMAQVLADMNHLYEYFMGQKVQAEQEREAVAKELEDHQRIVRDEAYDLEFLLQLKQGQVEVPPSAIVTDYSDAIVLAKEVVESRNRRIVELGAEKVGILSNTREFRKKLNLVDWEHKLLHLQTVDLEERTKDVHMLRVTKDLQRVLKGSDQNQNKAECDLLERKLEHVAQQGAQKEQIIRKKHAKILQETRSKRAENEMLEKRLRELQQNVMQREHIKRVRAPTGGGGGGIAGEKRKIIGGGGKIEESEGEAKQAAAAFRDVEQRRSLRATAEKQTREINMLRKELDRLRQKTFPSFVHLHEARIANPDEREG